MIPCPSCQHENPDGSSFCENCGKPLAAPSPRLGGLNTLSGLNTIGGEETQQPRKASEQTQSVMNAGEVFGGRYAIESTIGSGGMGVIYRAHDQIGDREVALKLIRPEYVGGEAAVKRLIAEGVTTQDIRHKNIVSVYDVGRIEQQPYVAMEFVDGVSLREWQRQRMNAREEVPLRIAARIIAEVLDGLTAAHERGVVHRDLKPENIMLTSEPTDKAAPLKILDFGIARAAQAQTSNATGTGIGTPRYMAPEQITNPDAAQPSADLYSLSVIFYELLVGVLPQGHWQPPSGGRPDVSPAIDELIEAGLSNRPLSRPQTAPEYRQRLVEAVNAGAGYRPPPPPPPPPPPIDPRRGQRFVPPDTAPRTGMPKWRKWVLIGVGALVLLSVLAAIGDKKPVQNTSDHVSILNSDDGADNVITPDGDDNVITPDGDETATPNPPPPPSNPYAALSGNWLDDSGGRVNVQFGTDGSFGGTGTLRDGSPVSISGSLNGITGAGRFMLTTVGGAYNGTMAWDHQCHIPFQLFYANGAPFSQGQFHVNHAPGAPCPT